MSVDEAGVDTLANEMLAIFRARPRSPAISVDVSLLSNAQAYEVQHRVIAMRVASGERAVGYKVGCTSPAIRAQLGLEEPICGHLMAPHIHPSGCSLDIGGFIGCAVEPELVLGVGAPLAGNDVPDAELMAAIEWVAAGIEVHHYRFFQGQPTVQELIASNGIHAAVVVSDDRRPLDDADLALERVEIWRNRRLAASGVGSEILGGPLRSLRWLVSYLTRTGRRLEPGALVIPGSAVELVRVGAGYIVEARFSRFGSASVCFTGEESSPA